MIELSSVGHFVASTAHTRGPAQCCHAEQCHLGRLGLSGTPEGTAVPPRAAGAESLTWWHSGRWPVGSGTQTSWLIGLLLLPWGLNIIPSLTQVCVALKGFSPPLATRVVREPQQANPAEHSAFIDGALCTVIWSHFKAVMNSTNH